MKRTELERQMETNARATWARAEDRLAQCVAHRLGVAVTLREWRPLPNGASVPVFAVPAQFVAPALALGLECVAL